MSGVYIKGMEMPFTGSIKTIVIYPDGTVRTRRQDPLPYIAIPIPPHGLIDRERILDSVRIELAQANAVNDMEDYDLWMQFFDYIRKFPTIIPAEEGE